MDYNQFIAALCIWREARGSSMSAMTGIWHVIQNRANDPRKRWPDTTAEVCTEPFQFSSFNANDPNAVLLPTMRAKLDWAAWQRCVMVVTSPMNADPTYGATNYHSFPVGVKGKPQWPRWATDQAFTVQIGVFSFYKL